MINNFTKITLFLLITLTWITSQATETIELTQTACQFIEPEGKDNKFRSNHAEDCNRINNETGATRLTNSKVLRLKPGQHIFRIANKNVPYTLGFWLRGKGLARLTLPSTSGGGIETGQFRDYPINLKEGTYLFSCPLNPTPNYTLIVES